jgi:hypothetical protein
MKCSFCRSLVICLAFSIHSHAQHPISLDAGFMQQINHHMPGINGSMFYYFNQHLTGGIEVNRFFSKQHFDEKLSSWDVEINFHYILPVVKNIKMYPIIGIGHTSEKEINNETNEAVLKKFFSANTGAGVLVKYGRWLPHIEYTCAWGQVNQQFILTGISYELEFKRH